LFPTAICCPGHRYGTFALPARRNEGSLWVRGRALLSFRLEPVVRQRSLLSLQIETCAPFDSCLAHCPLSLSLLLTNLSRYCRSRTLTWSRLRVILWVGLQDWARAGTFRAVKSDHLKSAPKRLRNLLDPRNRPLPICRDFYLPGVHLNDLAWLRAAIIASCIIRATQELRQSPIPLTFLVPVFVPVRGPAAHWLTCGPWW
jgi:hypothetical protein